MISPRNTGADTSTPSVSDTSTTTSRDSADSQESTPTPSQTANSDLQSTQGQNIQEQNQKGFLQNAFIRRMTNEGEKKRHRDSNETIKEGNGSVLKEGGDLDNHEER